MYSNCKRCASLKELVADRVVHPISGHFVALRILGCGGGVRSVPGIVDRRGTTTEHRSSPREPHQPKLARNSDTQTLCSTPKRCNSNDAISTFEIHVGELRATFLRNHNMRRHKGTTKCPKQKTTQAEDNSSTEDPRNPDSRHNRHKHGGTAPVMWRCTRYVAVHPLRGGAPEQKRCIAYGSGAAPPTYKNKRGTGTPNHSPPHPSMRTWALLAAGWARRPRHHLHSGPLRPTPTPPTPLNAKSPFRVQSSQSRT